MRALVIGGTGFIGRHVVRRLLDAGVTVAVIARRERRVDFGGEVELLNVDRNDPVALCQSLGSRSFDVIIDNVVYDAPAVRSAIDLFSGRTGRYVLNSSAAVYLGIDPQLPLREEDARYDVERLPARVGDFPMTELREIESYILGKIAAERALLEQDRLPYTIVRAPSVIGPLDSYRDVHFYVERILDRQPVGLTDGGRQHIQPIYVDDMAQVLVGTATAEGTAGRASSLSPPTCWPNTGFAMRSQSCSGARQHLKRHRPSASSASRRGTVSHLWER
jgi:nucleoside-diphosphate-sugar epimerase